MKLIVNILKTILSPFLSKQINQVSFWHRNAKILNAVESQSIQVYQSKGTNDGMSFSFVVTSDNTLSRLNPYYTINSEVQAMRWMGMWEQKRSRKLPDNMSLSERLYTLLHHNQIAASDVEIDLNNPNFEVVHIYFA